MVNYRLSRLAPGSYDVLLNGEIIASLARNGRHSDSTWSAELLSDLPVGEMPAPFVEPEHTFKSLEEARNWLGGGSPVGVTLSPHSVETPPSPGSGLRPGKCLMLLDSPDLGSGQERVNP